jgi:hypothetical protein
LNHFVLFFTYYFFPICCAIPNDLNFFKHVANLTWGMNPKSNHHFGHFSYKCDLVKCNCPYFYRAKKMIFAISNVGILQSTKWKILNFFPHIFKLFYYKILRLYVFKNVFHLKFGACIRNGSFEAFLVKT